MSRENLQEELTVLFQEAGGYAQNFRKQTYASDMDALAAKYAVLLDEVKESIEESDEMLLQVAEVIPDHVAEQLAALTSKRKRGMESLNYNLTMVSYFIPLMGEMQSVKTRTFTEKIVELWNERMPENKIGHATREGIQNGFKKGLCYITTAVCRSLDKPDDCYELTTLRNYRDQYLLSSEEGNELVQEYYNIAPTIVKRIDRSADADQVYREIWNQYLKPCVRLIEEEKRESCEVLYSDMVKSLERRYLYS